MQIGSDCLRNRGNDPVACRMPESIIERFKVIDIKHTDRKRCAQANRFFPLLHTVLVMPASVGDPRHLIRLRLPFDLPAVVVQLDMGIHPRLNDQRAERLTDIIDRAQCKSALFMLDIRKRSDHDDRHRLRVILFLQNLQQCKTVHSRHNNIQQDQRVIPRPRKLEPGLRRLLGLNLIFVAQNIT